MGMNDLPITLQELKEHLRSQREKISQKFGLKKAFNQFFKEMQEKKCIQSKKKRSSYGHVRTNMSPSDRRRRLAEATRMEEKDMDDMSPSELALHRRRLAHGAHVSPVLAPLMDEIEQAQHNY